MHSSIFLAIGVFAVVLNYSEAVITPKQTHKMVKVIMDCALKEQATQYDLDELFAHMPPTTKTAKCLHACVSEQLNLIKNNKLNFDGFVQMGRMKHDYNLVKIQIIRDIANECADTTDPDRCESASKIFRCIHNAAAARNLMFDV